MNQETLPPVGELKDWMVKGFPVTLRRAITAAAERRGVSVAQFVAAHFERHGVDGEPFTQALTLVTPPVNPQAPPPERPSLRDLVELAAAVSAGAKGTPRPLQLARRIVADELAARLRRE